MGSMWLPPNASGWLVLVLVVTAGCTGLGPPADSTIPAPTVQPLPAVESPSETTRCHCIRHGRFELHHLYGGTVEVTVIDVTDGRERVVADGVFSEQYDIVDFDPVLRYGADYRVTVRVDGEAAWNQTVRRSEGYEVIVTRNGTVRVLSHVMT